LQKEDSYFVPQFVRIAFLVLTKLDC